MNPDPERTPELTPEQQQQLLHELANLRENDKNLRKTIKNLKTKKDRAEAELEDMELKQNYAEAFSKPKINVRTPDIFSGKNQHVDDWLFQLDLYFKDSSEIDPSS